MKKLLVMIWMVAAVAAADEWTAEDTALELTYAAVHVADWAQTRYMARSWDRPTHVEHYTMGNTGVVSFRYHREGNIILGSSPSVSEVDLYMASSLAAHAAISYVLPKPYRNYWQMLSIGFEGGVVAHNFNAGVRMRF